MRFRDRLFYLFLVVSFSSLGQDILLRGSVQSTDGIGITDATIEFPDMGNGTITDQKGEFSIQVPSRSTIRLIISHVSFSSLDTVITTGQSDQDVSFELSISNNVLPDIEIIDSSDLQVIRQNVISVDAKSAQNLPSPFNDFSKVLTTLPGVSSNNELSTTYSVRGGNFDENLVYVDDIPIYRPFLANSGRQEGLSFVNPNMVSNIDFYAGGWSAKYGDKLSSSLNIEYKEPVGLEGNINVGLLGGSAYIGNSNRSERIKYLIGVRHKDSQYLLNTLEIEGEYFPRFTDFQSLFTFDLTRKKSNFRNRTKLNWLFSYGRNRYLTKPTSQLTEFGSVSQNFRLQTAFIGRELLDYDTYQTGIRLSHWLGNKLKTSLIVSTVLTNEEENFDVEGGYRLCDVDNNPASGTFDNCVIVRGVGTQYDYGRNELEAALATVENRYELVVGKNGILEGGLGITYQDINDEINEYSFIDSADFISLTHSAFNSLDLRSQQFFGYLQYQLFSKDSLHEVNMGIRGNLWSESNQLLISPRLLYRLKPRWRQPTYFNFSVGRYQQHPFYRELRNSEGLLNENVTAQKSTHFIAGIDRFMTLWGRPFVLNIQTYYKLLSDLIPYEVDNLRLRYFADNNASGYARGFDIRFNGEFIKGTQSWFSLGLLQTKEDIDGDNRGYIRRPADQMINFGAYFEDHMPNDPSVRVYLSLNFGSGFPFGPPGNRNLRNVFSGDEYYRADLGLSKSFTFSENKALKNLWLRLEVLNVQAADNTLSYTWIEDVNGTSFAIPNSLSARFLNVRISTEF